MERRLERNGERERERERVCFVETVSIRSVSKGRQADVPTRHGTSSNEAFAIA